MSQLSQFDKSRIRYHLGYYIVSVPAGDYARLEEAMNSVPDSVFADKIIYQINRCDAAERKTQLASFEKEFNSWKGDREQIDDVCVMGVRIT